MLSYTAQKLSRIEEKVAVPINYGMLYYQRSSPRSTEPNLSQSPSIMECSTTSAARLDPLSPICRSPHQLWNALLRECTHCRGNQLQSQSPSIMECSPTGGKWSRIQWLESQSPSIMECSPTNCFSSKNITGVCRSPHQLWNALLLKMISTINSTFQSQSPSIMECSPTLRGHRFAVWRLSQSPSIMECSPTVNLAANDCTTIVAVPINYGMLSY